MMMLMTLNNNTEGIKIDVDEIAVNIDHDDDDDCNVMTIITDRSDKNYDLHRQGAGRAGRVKGRAFLYI